MDFDGFDAVLGAGWREATFAIAQKCTKYGAIELHQPNEQRFHASSGVGKRLASFATKRRNSGATLVVVYS